MQFSIETYIASVNFSHTIKALNIGKFIYPRMIYFPRVWNIPCVLWWKMLSIALLSHRMWHTITMTICSIFRCNVLSSMLIIVVSSVYISMFGLCFPSMILSFLCHKRLGLVRLYLSVRHLRSLNFKSLRLILIRWGRCRMRWRFNKINMWWWWRGCSISISNSLSVSMRVLRLKKII